MEKPNYEEIDEGGGYLCNVAFCPACGNRLYGAKICAKCQTLIDYSDDEDWICSECAKEFGGHARRINEEDLQKAIQSSLDAYRGREPGSFFREEGQKALDQPGNE